MIIGKIDKKYNKILYYEKILKKNKYVTEHKIKLGVMIFRIKTLRKILKNFKKMLKEYYIIKELNYIFLTFKKK